MDYSEIRKMGIALAQSQGVNPNYFDTAETFYFDETDNVRKFVLRDGAFNVSDNCHFVLGGVVASDSITLDELKSELKLQKNLLEVKSKHVYKEDFVKSLKSDKLNRFLQLVLRKKWFVHFYNLNLLYFSLVDIVDSIDCEIDSRINDIKTMLYIVVKDDIASNSSLLYKYNYPNVPKDQGKAFVNDLLNVIKQYAKDNSQFKEPLNWLYSWLLNGVCQNQFSLIQDNQDFILIERLGDFYLQKIYMMPYSNIVFDNEIDVKRFFKEDTVELDGRQICNYSFVDSKQCVMVQVSDIVVGILGRYFKFLDRATTEINSDINAFDEKQLETFKLLNKILKISVEHNPLFHHHSTDLLEYQNFVSCFTKYSE